MDSTLEHLFHSLSRISNEIQAKGIENFVQDLQNPDLNPSYHNEEFVKPMNKIA
jgi:hypothetical protein